MLKLITFFLVFGIPIISNAAGIYNNLVNIDDKNKEKLENIKIISEYDAELLSILRKNEIMQKSKDNFLSYRKLYTTDIDRGDFSQAIFRFSDEFDSQALLEAEMAWSEIKSDLDSIRIILDTIDMWEKDWFEKYFDENIDINYLVISDIKQINSSKDRKNVYEKSKNTSSIYKNHAHGEYKYNNRVSLNNNDLSNVYEKDDEETAKNYEKNIFSIIYLWEMYSDIIVIALGIVALLLVISNLIKFLLSNRYGKF